MERLKHIVQINIVLGVWLVVAPFVMGYSGSTVELETDVIVGLWFIACSWWMLAAGSGRMTASVLQLLAGVGLAAAPFLSHYQRLSRPFDNDIVVGVLCVVVSATAMWMLASKLRTAA